MVGLFFIFSMPSNLIFTPDIINIKRPQSFTVLRAAIFGDIKEISIVISAKKIVNNAISTHLIYEISIYRA
jgi:hypothetical protein